MHFREEPSRQYIDIGCANRSVAMGKCCPLERAAASAATKIGRRLLTRGPLTSPLRPSDLTTLIPERDSFDANDWRLLDESLHSPPVGQG
jgi:hypothetical protein